MKKQRVIPAVLIANSSGGVYPAHLIQATTRGKENGKE